MLSLRVCTVLGSSLKAIEFDLCLLVWPKVPLWSLKTTLQNLWSYLYYSSVFLTLKVKADSVYKGQLLSLTNHSFLVLQFYRNLFGQTISCNLRPVPLEEKSLILITDNKTKLEPRIKFLDGSGHGFHVALTRTVVRVNINTLALALSLTWHPSLNPKLDLNHNPYISRHSNINPKPNLNLNIKCHLNPEPYLNPNISRRPNLNLNPNTSSRTTLHPKSNLNPNPSRQPSLMLTITLSFYLLIDLLLKNSRLVYLTRQRSSRRVTGTRLSLLLSRVQWDVCVLKCSKHVQRFMGNWILTFPGRRKIRRTRFQTARQPRPSLRRDKQALGSRWFGRIEPELWLWNTYRCCCWRAGCRRTYRWSSSFSREFPR